MALIDNLISYWKLDESSGNAEDAHGANDLVNNGGMSYVAGKINNGAECKPTKYLSISDAAQIGLDFGTGAFSISLWLKTSASILDDEILEKQRTSGTGFYQLKFHSTDAGKIQYEIGDSAVTISSPSAINDGTFKHIVCIRNGSSLKMYINNVEVASRNDLGSIDVSNNGPFYLGHGNNIADIDIVLDEVALWDKALTTDEIAELYNSGNGNQYPFESILTVDTGFAFNITKNTADIPCIITNEGVDEPDYIGFVWDTVTHSNPGDVAPNLTDYDYNTSESGSFPVGTYNRTLSSLIANTTYYVRACAHNSDGWIYGDEISFSTLESSYIISGIISLNSTPVESATVKCFRESDSVEIASETTNSSGFYKFENLDSEETYTLYCQYEIDDVKYNSLVYYGIVPKEEV